MGKALFNMICATAFPPVQIALILGAKLFGNAPAMDGSDWLAAFVIPGGSWYYLLFG